jgi:hypothetical protein
MSYMIFHQRMPKHVHPQIAAVMDSCSDHMIPVLMSNLIRHSKIILGYT